MYLIVMFLYLCILCYNMRFFILFICSDSENKSVNSLRAKCVFFSSDNLKFKSFFQIEQSIDVSLSHLSFSLWHLSLNSLSPMRHECWWGSFLCQLSFCYTAVSELLIRCQSAAGQTPAFNGSLSREVQTRKWRNWNEKGKKEKNWE